jgi:hypothetical protein
LEIEIGGKTQATQYDYLVVTGTAMLAGELQLVRIGGFTPDPTDMFTIGSAASVEGAFSNVANGQRLATTDGTGAFLVHYGLGSAFSANEIVLSGVAAMEPGDFNLDGTVDAADYVVWRKNPGGIYTQADYDAWRAHFGQTAGGGAGASAKAAVPEPSVIALLIIGALAIYARRRATASQLLVRGTRSSNDLACSITVDWRVC